MLRKFPSTTVSVSTSCLINQRIWIETLISLSGDEMLLPDPLTSPVFLLAEWIYQEREQNLKLLTVTVAWKRLQSRPQISQAKSPDYRRATVLQNGKSPLGIYAPGRNGRRSGSILKWTGEQPSQWLTKTNVTKGNFSRYPGSVQH